MTSPFTGQVFSFLGASLVLGAVYAWTLFWVFLILCAALAFLGLIRILNRMADRLPAQVAHPIHWIHALAFEGFAVAATAFLHPVRYFSSQRVGSPDGRPILLIHGYLHDSSAWVYHKRQLRKEGFGPIYVLNLGHPFRSIRHYAEKVKMKAEQIERETNRSDLILIGHSMGGLVSSWYAMRLAPPGKVTDVITIGSPLAGTYVAKIGIGPPAREMERDSELLEELREKIKKSAHTRFFHIATKTDQLVIPYSSALVGGHLERQYLLEDVGHVTLLFSPRVAKKISDWLRN